MSAHLFAFGGGGFYGPRGGPSLLLKEVLLSTQKKYPRICLIPTAGGDKPETFQSFSEVIYKLGATANYLSLYAVPTSNIEDWLSQFDAVYISGGNTRNLLALWREWQLDQIIIRAMQRGLVVSGASAGANCWFQESSSDFIPGEFNPLNGLGYLSGSFCPHFSDEKGRRLSYINMIQNSQLKDGYGVSDRAGLHFIDCKLNEVLLEWDQASAYFVKRNVSGDVTQTQLSGRILS